MGEIVRFFAMWCIDKKPPVFQNVCHVIVNYLLSFNFYRRAREGGRRGTEHLLEATKELNTESKVARLMRKTRSGQVGEDRGDER